jgi:alpha-1,3-rhamnosyl/mannosyltransferase
MRICIDATSLLLRSAGVKNYVYHWMRALQAEGRDLEITAFPALGDVGTLDHERSVLSAAQTIPRIALLHFLNIRWNPAIDVLLRDADVFHASNLVRNPPRRTKLTGTLYDLTCMLMPQYHTAANVAAERNFYDKVVRRAAGLIAISQSTRQDAVRLLGIDPERITVVYPGIPEAFRHVAPADIDRVRSLYRLDKPYMMFVGTVEPRKNVDGILDAFAALPADVRTRYDLAIAGPIGWAAGTTVQRLRSGEPGVRVLGYVPEADLPALTAGARVFVYPSHYEGFGFPVAQAMAAGVPVITSNISSLPEVAGEAGLLIDPSSQSELRDAMVKLLTSDTLHSDLAGKTRPSAARFTWEGSAQESAAFFRKIG